MRMKLILALALLALPMLGRAQGTAPNAPRSSVVPSTGTVIYLWPNGAPGFEARKDIPEQAASYWVKNVNNPSLTVFLPPKEKATGAAVILCPGGGFRELGFIPEGIEAAKYFNSIGVAAFALKYRLPREPGSVYNMSHPRQDGLRAMRLVRSRAVEWGIDPNRIGMVGFSAGGEVVSMTAFSENAGDVSATDPIDKVSARPDFIVEIYPGGAGIPQALPANAPTAFLLVADDDDHTDSVFSIFRLYRAAKLPVEVHVFTKGQHAFNMGTRSKLTTIKNWPQRMADWMGDNNLLDPAVPAKNSK
ncbi:MAG: alpha/beta hydrolase [Chthonomonadales bacterium]|nr:alpha/beta hydrolase [Chthonomonadales bacterium]